MAGSSRANQRRRSGVALKSGAITSRKTLVRPHQRMRAARRHHAERPANVLNSLIEGQCRDREMIEIQYQRSALFGRRLVPWPASKSQTKHLKYLYIMLK